MEWERFISIGITSLVTAGVLTYLNRSAKNLPTQTNFGITELRMNKLYAFLGWLCVGLSVFALVLPFFLRDDESWLYAFLMVFLFSLLGLPIFLWYRNHRIRFDDRQISGSTWLGKETTIPWDKVEEVKFRPFQGVLEVRSGEKKIKAHQHLVGLTSLLDKMEVRTEVKREKIKRLPPDLR